MRSYAKNSPQAVARFLVLTVNPDRLDLAVLEHFPALYKFGLDAALVDAVLAEYCADTRRSHWAGADFRLEFKPGEVAALLKEIDRPALQRSLCRVALSVTGVDQSLHSGEATLLWAALDAWDLPLANILRSPKAQIPKFMPEKAVRPITFQL